jgi:hypothetical protein
LKSLQFFYEGYFNPSDEQESKKVFRLQNVQERFEGKTYATLDERDRLHIDNTTIHATVIKQESPANEDTSIYHVFERLNTGGRKLTAQEIRIAVYHGALIEALDKINQYGTWRSIYGKVSPRLKDQELILRHLALYYGIDDYQKPMVEFLNRFAGKHRTANEAKLAEFQARFCSAIDVVYASIGPGAFRRGSTLNAAVFDAVMVGISRRLDKGPIKNLGEVASAYGKLIDQGDFVASTEKATSNDATVRARIGIATEAFKSLE